MVSQANQVIWIYCLSLCVTITFSLLSGSLEMLFKGGGAWKLTVSENNCLDAVILLLFWDAYCHLRLGRPSTVLEGHETGHEAPVKKHNNNWPDKCNLVSDTKPRGISIWSQCSSLNCSDHPGYNWQHGDLGGATWGVVRLLHNTLVLVSFPATFADTREQRALPCYGLQLVARWVWSIYTTASAVIYRSGDTLGWVAGRCPTPAHRHTITQVSWWISRRFQSTVA